MEPVDPSKRMPEVGDEVIPSERTKNWFFSIASEYRAGNKCIISRVENRGNKEFAIAIKCGVEKQGFIIHENGYEAWTNTSNFIVFYYPEKVSQSCDLKSLNMRRSSIKCAKCNGNLKEPYPGIKFCPVCEA